jgi:hypothetical protein
VTWVAVAEGLGIVGLLVALWLSERSRRKDAVAVATLSAAVAAALDAKGRLEVVHASCEMDRRGLQVQYERALSLKDARLEQQQKVIRDAALRDPRALEQLMVDAGMQPMPLPPAPARGGDGGGEVDDWLSPSESTPPSKLPRKGPG